MDLIKNEFIVSRITIALYMPKEKGAPIHRDRPTHGLVYNVDCRATYRFETGEVLTCHSGECIYLPKGSNYTAERRMERDTKERGVYAINFLTIPEENDNHPFVIRIKGKQEIQSLFFRAASAWQRKEVGFYEECLADLYKIVRIIKKEATQYSSRKKVMETIAPALQYINENYTTENISLARLAALCKISEPYLRKLFQQAFSVSPAVYMRSMRVEYAKELLRSQEYSVTEVATLSGFNDPAYFAREFKKVVGVSPKNYANEKRIHEGNIKEAQASE